MSLIFLFWEHYIIGYEGDEVGHYIYHLSYNRYMYHSPVIYLYRLHSCYQAYLQALKEQVLKLHI